MGGGASTGVGFGLGFGGGGKKRRRAALLDKYKEPLPKKEPIGSFNRPYDAQGNGALHLAAVKCAPKDHLVMLINGGARVDHVNDDGRTALHLCALQGAAAPIDILFEAKADFRLRDHDGRTPLHLAAMHGYELTVKKLLRCVMQRAEADGVTEQAVIMDDIAEYVNAPDTIGRSALMWAVYSGYMKEKSLAQQEVEFNLAEQKVKARKPHYNFCMMATGNQMYPCWGALRQNTVDSKRERARYLVHTEMSRLLRVCELFMKYKARIDAVDMSGSSVLDLSLMRTTDNRRELWNVLLKEHKDLRFETSFFMRDGPRGTVLHHAASVGDGELTRFILENVDTADLPALLIEDEDQHQRTALHLAAEQGHAHIVEILQAFGAPTDAADANGHTPADLAYEKNNKAVAEQLAMKISVNDYAGAGKLNDVQAAVRSQPQVVDRRDAKGRTPLMAACLCKQTECAMFLLESKADPNGRDKQGYDAFSWLLDPTGQNASATRKLSSALVAAGLDLHGTGHPTRITPLMLCGSAGNLQLTKLVLEARSDVNASTTQGKTALHLAVLAEHLEVVRDLVAAKADPMKADEKGFTSIALALRSTTLEMREMLQQSDLVVSPVGKSMKPMMKA